VDRREEARAAAVSEERLPRVAHAGPAGDDQGRVRPGAKRDRTRSPAFYEGVYDYLTAMGVVQV
jgi:hypothetical protein